MQPSIVFLTIYLREIKKKYLHKKLYTNIHSSFDSPKVETTQMFFNGRMVKQTVVYPPQGIHSAFKGINY